jgi:hypothetical protein
MVFFQKNQLSDKHMVKYPDDSSVIHQYDLSNNKLISDDCIELCVSLIDLREIQSQFLFLQWWKKFNNIIASFLSTEIKNILFSCCVRTIRSNIPDLVVEALKTKNINCWSSQNFLYMSQLQDFGTIGF